MSKSLKKARSDINVSNIVQKNSDNNFGTNSLSFIISGNKVNHIVSNTIIRAIISLVGSHAFHPDNMTFTKDTTISNPDVLRMRISNIPIIYKNYEYPTISNFPQKCVELEILHNKDKITKKTELEEIEEKNKKTLELVNNLHMYVNVKNNTKDILHVTTNKEFTTFYYNGVIIPDFYPREISIMDLKPGEELVCSAVADFNIPVNGDMYRTAVTPFHLQQSETSYKIYLESYRQIPEKDIVKYACDIIIIKLNNFKNTLINQIKSNNNANIEHSARIEIIDENHTIAEVFTRFVQDHPNIKFAGFKNDHPDVNNIIFEYETEGMTISKIITSVVNELSDLYSHVRDNIV